MSVEEGENSVTMFGSKSPEETSPEKQQMSFGVAVPGKQKGTATQALGTSVEETNVWKKPRQENQSSNVDIERTLREEALSQEVEKLKKALERKQEENEVLISIIDRLTWAPK
jgi:hypothetical protein